MRKGDIGSLIETSDDPNAIIGQLWKQFDLKEIDAKPATRRARRRAESRTQSCETMTDDIDYMAHVSVSKWVFGPSPEAREKVPDLEIEDAGSFEIHETKSGSGDIDDGSFPQDPVLQMLRAKLREVNAARACT